MTTPKSKILACALTVLTLLVTHAALATDNRAPATPTDIQVGAGYKVHFHAYAVGVQIYVCRNVGTPEVPRFAWVFVAPEAVLFDLDGDVVGIHYAGPSWESESGSKVVGARVSGVTVDPSAIPWLLLQARTTEGPGIFEQTKYIQRVNTTGGLPPSTGADAAHLGQEVRVPYTAEYFFYREQ